MLTRTLKHELPLITFTVCAPTSVGACWCALFLMLLPQPLMLTENPLPPDYLCTLICSLALAGVGMLASIAHLAKPLRAPRALTHWRTSWLSREIFLVAAFAVLVLAAVTCGCITWLGTPCFRGMLLCTVLGALVGLALLYAIAKAYRVHGQPGWDGPEGLMEVCAIALATGLVAGVCLSLASGFPRIELLFAGCLACLIAGGLALNARGMRTERLSGLEPLPRVLEAQRALATVKPTSRVCSSLFFLAAALFALASLLGMPAIAWVALVVCVAASLGLRICFYALATTARYVPQNRANFRW